MITTPKSFTTRFEDLNPSGLVALSTAGVIVSLLIALLAPQMAHADYEQAGIFAQTGHQALLEEAEGLAVNPSGVGGVEPGSLYAAGSERIDRFGPQGEFKEAWGWNTIASGPDLPNQANTLNVSATAGTYELTLETGVGLAHTTKGSTEIEVDTTVGAFHVGDSIEGFRIRYARATGTLTAGSKQVSIENYSGSQLVGLNVFGPGVPPDTTITAYSVETTAPHSVTSLTLSKPATTSETAVSLAADPIVTAVEPGSVEMSLPAPETTTRGGGESNALLDDLRTTERVPSISFDASAPELEAALLALPAFEAGDLSVAGGQGDAEGTKPYELSFAGAYTGSPVSISANSAELSGGVPTSKVSVATTVAASTPGFQRCRVDVGDRCTLQPDGAQYHEEGVGRFNGPAGIAIDQATGDVYVLNNVEPTRTNNQVEVFSADGSEVIARFGEDATSEESFASTPEKFHQGETSSRSIAVDEAGVVYVGEHPSGAHPRVMCFRPQTAAEYHHYAYCGQSHDLATSSPEQLAVDNSGDLYVSNRELIEERSIAEPTAKPLCTLVPKGKAFGMTTNPETGEVFYYNGSPAITKIYRLKPCDPQVGKFAEAQAAISVNPKTEFITQLAFDPLLKWSPERSPGVLYGAATGEVGSDSDTGVYVFAPAEVHPPTVVSESLSSARTTSAILRAEIDPRGFETHYVFQYLTEAEYQANEASDRFFGAREVPAGGGVIPAGAPAPVSAAATGLSPDTTYRFRVIATSECNVELPGPCEATGEDATFGTYPLFPPGLPDNRAYELVSPAQKHGGEVLPANPGVGSCPEPCKPDDHGVAGYPIQVAPDGEAVSYQGQPFSPFEGPVNYDSYVSTRTSAGWQTTAMLPALPIGARELSFDSDLQHGLLALGGSALELQDVAPPMKGTPLLTTVPPNRAENEFRIAYAGSSPDFSRVLFSANDALTGQTPYAPEPPDPGVSGKDLYEWHEGDLALVNVLPGNAAIAPGATIASENPESNAVSSDGSRIFWNDGGGQLYVRESGQTTQAISVSQRGTPDPVGSQAAQFWNASKDGSRAVFSSHQELTDGANTGPIVQTLTISATSGSFILKYKGSSTAPIPLKTKSNPPTPTAAELSTALQGLSTIGAGNVEVGGSLASGFTIERRGAMAASETLIEANGSSLSGGTLSLSASHTGTALYEWNEGTLTDITAGQAGFQGIAGHSDDLSHVYFIDTSVLPGSGENERHESPQSGKANLYLYSSGSATAFVATLDSADSGSQASPAGRYLAFLSTRSLTGANTVGPCGAGTANIPCPEVYLYDSASGHLICASCSPTGAPPLGQTHLVQAEGRAKPRYLTDEGRLYFDTANSLASSDTNEGVEDVYEYEPDEAGREGTCGRESGCLFLISAGTEDVDSNLLAVDETGANVFFDTRDQLSLLDKDELLDVYDAREGGGIPAETEVGRSECQGEACQPLPSQPSETPPSSAYFKGAGNVHESHKPHKHHKKKPKTHQHKKRNGDQHHRRHGRATKRDPQGGAK